jgi:hypothetical protein
MIEIAPLRGMPEEIGALAALLIEAVAGGACVSGICVGPSEPGYDPAKEKKK